MDAKEPAKSFHDVIVWQKAHAFVAKQDKARFGNYRKKLAASRTPSAPRF